MPGTHERHRGLRLGLGKTLVVKQVALSLLLLVGAGLFVRTLANLQNVDAGFDERNLLLFGIDPTQDGYKEQRLADFYQEFTRRLQALPGVRSVSLSGTTLIGGGVSIRLTRILGYTPKAGEKKDGIEAWVNGASPGFFQTLGIPIVLGRGIREGDTVTAPKVAAVNEQFVRKYLGSGSPIGRRFGFGDQKSNADLEIVGVAGDAKFNDLRQQVPPTVYKPYLQEVKSLGGMHFEVRTAGDPMALAPAVRRVSQGMNPNLAIFDVKSQVEQINETMFQERLFARLTSFFGLLAALEASRLVASFLFGLKPNDPLTIAGAALLMVAAAAVAGYLPARRASRVDPMVALRHE